MIMEAFPFGHGWVWSATPLHPYKPLGLLAGTVPTVKEQYVFLPRVGAKYTFSLRR